MKAPLVVALCGRDGDLNILEPGTHLAEAIYLENQPEGTGWFIPPSCPACEEEELRRQSDPACRAAIDDYITSPPFVKLTDDLLGAAAFQKIMRQREE